MPVNILSRAHKNYINVELTGFNDVPCQLAMKIPTVGDGKNQWVITSVNPPKKKVFKWFEFEKHMCPNGGKNINKPISYFLDMHKQIKSKM